VANNFRCKIPHVKAFFAVLTDEQNGALFSHGEREIIRKHIPWTRVVADVGLRITASASICSLLSAKNAKTWS